MWTYLKIFIVFFLLDSNQISAQEVTKGFKKPAQGEVHALFIFVQFPDDKFCPDCKNWPIGKEPVFMDMTVDETWTGNPTPGGGTDYFAQMSFNELKLTGKEVHIIAPYTRQQYFDMGMKSRGSINQNIIETLDVDSLFDFAEFDNWHYITDYKHEKVSDGWVDMVFVIYRNINKDADYKLTGFGGYGDLGYKTFEVDEGLRKINGGFSGNGSGATLINRYNFNGFPEYPIHEFAHYLIGYNPEHQGFASWAMLDTWGSRSQMITFFERDKIGWTKDDSKIYDINGDTLTFTDIQLRDFITSGDALRIKIPGEKNQYFLIENHQLFSNFDITDNSKNTKGIFVFYQKGKRGNDVTFLPADGRYQWPLVDVIPNPYRGKRMSYVHVRTKGEADPVNGYTDCDKIAFSYNGVKYPPMQLNYFRNFEKGETELLVPFKGDGKDAFQKGYKEVFSPWSNTNSQKYDKSESGIGFEITDYDEVTGIYTVTVYINTALEGKPAKPMNAELLTVNNHPQISWDANLEPDLAHYLILKTNLADSNGTTISIVISKDENSYIDESLDISNKAKFSYTVQAIDSSGKMSISSDKIIVDSPK